MVGAWKDNARVCYFDKLGYGHIAGQNHQSHRSTSNGRKANQFKALHAKLRCYNSFGYRNMLRCRTANLKDIFADEILAELEDTSSDIDHLFGNEPAKQALKCFKTISISKEGDATILNILRLDAAIAETIDKLEKCVKDGTGRCK